MGAVGTHTLIGKITVGAAGVSSVTFSSIPSTYTDLKIVGSARTNRSGQVDDPIGIYFNGSNTSLTYRYIAGSGTVANSSNGANGYIASATAASATVSTFSNFEIMIPNYTSALYKSYSGDSVTENNATAAYGILFAGLWSSISPITSLTLLSQTSNSFQQYSTFSLYGIKTSSIAPSLNPQAFGGDIVVNDGTYWYHAFINTGTFVPKHALLADVLVVAGGGAGGFNQGGGGGAGGVVYTASQYLSSGTIYTSTVGVGGAGVTSSTYGGNGGNSNLTGGILSLTAAIGGGAGGYNTNISGRSGGSGGGSASYNSAGGFPGGAGTSGQGNAGGAGYNYDASSGGGGGAGAVGQTAPSAGQSGAG